LGILRGASVDVCDSCTWPITHHNRMIEAGLLRDRHWAFTLWQCSTTFASCSYSSNVSSNGW